MRRADREARQREAVAHRALEALVESTFPGTVVLREEEVAGATVPKVTFPVGVLRGHPLRDLLTGREQVREVPGEGGADADSPPGASPHGWFP